MKALIVNNQSRSLSIFWRMLMEGLAKKGIQTIACVPCGDAESERKIAAAGARIANYALDRKGLNPLKDFASFRRLREIMRSEKPDIVFASTIKPVIYGCLAAKAERVPGIFAAITGLGYVFEQDKWHKRLIHSLASRMYRQALRNISGVFFQNRDDSGLFLAERIIGPGQRILYAPGTGVDLDYFAPATLPASEPVFLLIARLLEAKGIEDYAKAASILKKKWPKARFQLLGIPEKGPGAYPLAKVEEWQRKGALEYLGQTRDVRPFIAQSHVVALPSWREGTPTSLLEAMAMGRALVATDAPGCREAVRDGINGFLCPVRDPSALALAMENFLENPQLAQTMGKEGRKLACASFDGGKIASNMIDAMLALTPCQR